jgi:hypothetical protein
MDCLVKKIIEKLRWGAIYFYLFMQALGTGVFGFFNPFDLTQEMVDILIAFIVYVAFLYYLLGKTELTVQQKLMISLGIIAIQEVLLLSVPGSRDMVDGCCSHFSLQISRGLSPSL